MSVYSGREGRQAAWDWDWFLRYLRRVLLTRARARRPIHSWDLDRTRGRGESCPNGLEKGREWGVGRDWERGLERVGYTECCGGTRIPRIGYVLYCSEWTADMPNHLFMHAVYMLLHCSEWSAACGGDGMDSGTCRITYLCMLQLMLIALQ